MTEFISLKETLERAFQKLSDSLLNNSFINEIYGEIDKSEKENNTIPVPSECLSHKSVTELPLLDGSNTSIKKDAIDESDDFLGDDFYSTSEDEEVNDVKQISLSDRSTSLVSHDPNVLNDVEQLLEQIFCDNTDSSKGSANKSKSIKSISSSSDDLAIVLSISNENLIENLNDAVDKCNRYIASIPITESQLSNPPIDDIIVPTKQKRISNLIQLSDTDSGSCYSAKPEITFKKRKPFLKKKSFNRGVHNPSVAVVEPSQRINEINLAPSQRHLDIQTEVLVNNDNFEDILRRMNRDWEVCDI